MDVVETRMPSKGYLVWIQITRRTAAANSLAEKSVMVWIHYCNVVAHEQLAETWRAGLGPATITDVGAGPC